MIIVRRRKTTTKKGSADTVRGKTLQERLLHASNTSILEEHRDAKIFMIGAGHEERANSWRLSSSTNEAMDTSAHDNNTGAGKVKEYFFGWMLNLK